MTAKLRLHFDIRDMLPVIRKAYNEKTLQMFQPETPGGRACTYAGPCGIGVCIPEPLRPLLDSGACTDGGYSACTLFDSQHFTCEEGQREDIELIQELHDSASLARPHAWYDARAAEFGKGLTDLESKYGVNA
jgi:hypothetical protein